MNQILITGEEIVSERKQKKEKTVLPVNGIVIFFAICIIILGICIISGSIYSKNKINETVLKNTKPQVEINRNDENNTIEINVKHIRGIKQIAYRWNEEEKIIIDGKNSKNILETIDLLGGENKLTVEVTEENGQTTVYDKKYTVGNIPTIKLEAVSNGVQLKSTSEVKIDYISYNWDDGEEQIIEVGEKTYEGIINAPTGKHKLTIKVVDVNKMEAKKEQDVVGDTEPTLKIKPDYVDGKVAFIIDAEDDEKIIKVEIVHNSGEKETIHTDEKTYHKDLIMTTGETNTLIVTVTNINGLAKTSRVKFDNK